LFDSFLINAVAVQELPLQQRLGFLTTDRSRIVDYFSAVLHRVYDPLVDFARLSETRTIALFCVKAREENPSRLIYFLRET
jgi:hypothetical protein